MLFFPLAWLALTSLARRRRLICALGAGVCFTVCVYSYFYLWTAAAAWLTLLGLLWSIARPTGWRQGIESLVLMGALAGGALGPYALLLSHRAATMDGMHALERTHAFDLGRSWRAIEICALAIIGALVIGQLCKRINWRERNVLCAVAFAVLPFVLFNQQVVTGRSLQPTHYAQYVAPYTTLIAAALIVSLLWRGRKSNRRFSLSLVLLAACLSYFVGGREVWSSTRRFSKINVIRDEARPVALRLREIALRGYDNVPGAPANSHAVVFTPDITFMADDLPMVAPQAVLWAPHIFVFPGVTSAENKERFFQYLYYSGVDAEEFARHYQQQGFVQFALFGWERANPTLTVNYRPVNEEELAVVARDYAAYSTRFDRLRATQPTLAYLILVANRPFNSTQLDRWYTHDTGEHIGASVLYRLTLRE